MKIIATITFLLLFLFIYISLIQNSINIDIATCDYVGATGSSDNHAIYLSNVLYSFSVYNPNCILYCYNFYLTPTMYAKVIIDVTLTNKYLKKKKHKGKVVFVNYSQNIYSNDFAIFSMSFKPNIIYHLLKKVKKTVIWMDAGMEILKPLTGEADVAKKYGFYMDKNIHMLLDWVHPSAIRYFNFSRDMFVGLHDTEAGYLTVSYNETFIKTVIEPWYECSKHRECICPKNFSKKYYRRDQPALSMLLYRTYPYSKYVGKVQIRNSHMRQCDHRGGCNIISNYIKIMNSVIF